MKVIIDVQADPYLTTIDNIEIELTNIPEANQDRIRALEEDNEQIRRDRDYYDELLSRKEDELRVLTAKLTAFTADANLSVNASGLRAVLGDISEGAVYSKDHKISVIKMVRALTSCDLKEAKDLVDKYIWYVPQH